MDQMDREWLFVSVLYGRLQETRRRPMRRWCSILADLARGGANCSIRRWIIAPEVIPAVRSSFLRPVVLPVIPIVPAVC